MFDNICKIKDIADNICRGQTYFLMKYSIINYYTPHRHLISIFHSSSIPDNLCLLNGGWLWFIFESVYVDYSKQTISSVDLFTISYFHLRVPKCIFRARLMGIRIFRGSILRLGIKSLDDVYMWGCDSVLNRNNIWCHRYSTKTIYIMEIEAPSRSGASKWLCLFGRPPLGAIYRVCVCVVCRETVDKCL